MFISTLSIIVILLVLAFIPVCWNSFALLLERIFGTNGNRISVAAALLIPFAVFVLCSIIGLICCLIIKPKQSQVVEKKKSAIFYPFFFFSFGLTSLLPVPLCLAFIFNPFHFCYHIDYNFFIPAVYMGCLALALVQAALLMSAVTMWKVNKVVSFMLFAFVAISFLACVLPGWVGYEIADKDSYKYYSDSYYDNSDSAVAEPATYEGDDYEEPEPVLSNLWESSEYDKDSVSLAVGYFSERIRQMENEYSNVLDLWTYGHNSSYTYNEDDLYYGDDEKKIWPDKSDFYQAFRNQIKIVSYLQGNNDLILKAFMAYNGILFDAISSKVYYRSGAAELLAALSHAHDDLYDTGNSSSRLSKIYKLMTNIEHSVASEYYDDIKIHADKETLESYFKTDSGEIDERLVVWAYSFWARRYHDGTEEAAYSILQDIIGNYEGYD